MLESVTPKHLKSKTLKLYKECKLLKLETNFKILYFFV